MADLRYYVYGSSLDRKQIYICCFKPSRSCMRVCGFGIISRDLSLDFSFSFDPFVKSCIQKLLRRAIELKDAELNRLIDESNDSFSGASAFFSEHGPSVFSFPEGGSIYRSGVRCFEYPLLLLDQAFKDGLVSSEEAVALINKHRDSFKKDIPVSIF